MKIYKAIGAVVVGAGLIGAGAAASFAFGGQGGHGGWHRGHHGGGWHHGRGGHRGEYGMRGRMGDMLRRADANNDNRLERDEVKTARGERFKEFDRNSDGTVTEAEISEGIIARRRARIDRMAKRMIRRFDDNADGVVTAEEFEKSVERRFRMLDLDDNGVIEGDEMPRRMRHALMRGEGRGRGRGGRRGSGRDGYDRDEEVREAAPVETLDDDVTDGASAE